jgi:hypothetical protein
MTRDQNAMADVTADGGVATHNGAGESRNGGAGDAQAPDATPAEPPADLLARVLQLEGEVRRLRALLEVRNEAFRALMGRLVEVEVRAQASECERLRKERDEAVGLVTVLQGMKIFRYSRWPREVYGVFLRVRRRLR